MRGGDLGGWTAADTVASLLIVGLVVPRVRQLLREALDVLLQAAPRGDLEEVRAHIRRVDGVLEVHDLPRLAPSARVPAAGPFQPVTGGGTVEGRRSRQEEIAVEHGHHSGMWVPDQPPTWGRLFLPHVDGWSVLAVLSVVGLVVYLAAVVRLRRSGVAWPWWRTLAWISGTASLFAVTGTWLNGYSMVIFSVHMAQHMVLSLITPLLLLLAAPVTLALRTLPRGRGAAGAPRALLLGALHSRFARFVASPLFTVPLFIASLYGVYFTPLFDALMSSPAGHQFMLAHFVVTGVLFFGPIVGQDPWPRTLSYPGRMLELFLPVPFHAFFGVAIMMAGSLVVDSFAQSPAGWGIDPLADQSVAGGIVWAFGELPTVLVLAVVFLSWARSDDRRARTLDRAADRDGGAELEAYNARLRALAGHSTS